MTCTSTLHNLTDVLVDEWPTALTFRGPTALENSHKLITQRVNEMATSVAQKVADCHETTHGYSALGEDRWSARDLCPSGLERPPRARLPRAMKISRIISDFCKKTRRVA